MGALHGSQVRAFSCAGAPGPLHTCMCVRDGGMESCPAGLQPMLQFDVNSLCGMLGSGDAITAWQSSGSMSYSLTSGPLSSATLTTDSGVPSASFGGTAWLTSAKDTAPFLMPTATDGFSIAAVLSMPTAGGSSSADTVFECNDGKGTPTSYLKLGRVKGANNLQLSWATGSSVASVAEGAGSITGQFETVVMTVLSDLSAFKFYWKGAFKDVSGMADPTPAPRVMVRWACIDVCALPACIMGHRCKRLFASLRNQSRCKAATGMAFFRLGTVSQSGCVFFAHMPPQLQCWVGKGSAEGFTGAIRELRIYGKPLSDSDTASLASELAQKWSGTQTCDPDCEHPCFPRLSA